MPKLWTETVATHRRVVEDRILNTTAELVGRHGLLSVTMSRIAERTGISRATLYKYFPDVESILVAWHERRIATHLGQLAAAGGSFEDPAECLEALLVAYAEIARKSHGQADSELVAFLHRDEHVREARQRLHALMQGVLADARAAGDVRGDVSPAELATYCIHALGAAGSLPSKSAVRRLVAVVRAGLRPVSS